MFDDIFFVSLGIKKGGKSTTKIGSFFWHLERKFGFLGLSGPGNLLKSCKMKSPSTDATS